MTNTHDAALHKAARLVVLLHLDDQGKLAGLGCRKIAERYFPGTDFTTNSRDLKALPKVRKAVADISPLLCLAGKAVVRPLQKGKRLCHAD